MYTLYMQLVMIEWKDEIASKYKNNKIIIPLISEFRTNKTWKHEEPQKEINIYNWNHYMIIVILILFMRIMVMLMITIIV